MTNLDAIQAWALVLEILGISLAALHVFGPHISQIVSVRIDSVRGWFTQAGVAYSMESADADMSKSLDARDQIARENAHTFIFYLPSIVIAMYLVEYGDGAFWWIAEFFTSILFAIPIVMVLQAINIFVINVLVRIIALAGNGNIVAGIGFLLALTGLAMETFQVWHGPFRWVAYASWSAVALIGCSIGIRLWKVRGTGKIGDS